LWFCAGDNADSCQFGKISRGIVCRQRLLQYNATAGKDILDLVYRNADCGGKLALGVVGLVTIYDLAEED
jgi:hypothetical protein